MIVAAEAEYEFELAEAESTAYEDELNTFCSNYPWMCPSNSELLEVPGEESDREIAPPCMVELAAATIAAGNFLARSMSYWGLIGAPAVAAGLAVAGAATGMVVGAAAMVVAVGFTIYCAIGIMNQTLADAQTALRSEVAFIHERGVYLAPS